MKLSQNQIDETEIELDVAIVGSGYGGSVMAARLSPHFEWGRVAILERGKEFAPGDFPEKLGSTVMELKTKIQPLGLFEFQAFRDLDVLVGNGLGGTSLINAAVMLRPKPEVFQSASWPHEISDSSLECFYQRAEKMLSIKPYWDEQDVRAGIVPLEDRDKKDLRGRTPSERKKLEKTKVFQELAKEAGLSSRAVVKVPLAMNIDEIPDGTLNHHGVRQGQCQLCGNCVTGCNANAKNTLATNYLPAAKSAGARILTQIEVLWIDSWRSPHHRYTLVCRSVGHSKPKQILVHANDVILSAGVLGTLKILFESKSRGLSVSDRLGEKISGNADTVAFSLFSDRKSNSHGFLSSQKVSKQETGPTITAALDLRNGMSGKVLQEGAFPVGLSLPKVSYNNSMIWLSMGRDEAEGKAVLRENGRLDVHWPQSGYQEEVHSAREIFEKFSESLEAVHIENPREAFPVFGKMGSVPISVHPLGGAVLSETVDQGVVNPSGQLWKGDGSLHPGLYVVDGSVVPTSIGVNPSLTIAALAERAAENFLIQRKKR